MNFFSNSSILLFDPIIISLYLHHKHIHVHAHTCMHACAHTRITEFTLPFSATKPTCIFLSNCTWQVSPMFGNFASINNICSVLFFPIYEKVPYMRILSSGQVVYTCTCRSPNHCVFSEPINIQSPRPKHVYGLVLYKP